MNPGLSAVLDPLLHAYSIIFFTRNRWLGAVLLSCTLLSPALGLYGLAGLAVALFAARRLGYAEESLRDGSLLFNSLLVSLALGYLAPQSNLPAATLGLLLVFFSVLTLLVTAAFNRWMYAQAGLPSLSLPFVVVCFALTFVFYGLTRTPLAAVAAPCLLPEPTGWPDPVSGFLQSFGAIFYLPHAGVGLLIFLSMLSYSRLALLYAVVGYASGRLFLEALGLDAHASATAWLGFNCVFCGLALGGQFFVPGRAGLALVVLAGFACALTGLAVKTFLMHFNVPPLALPFNLVTLGLVYALRQRARFHHLIESTGPSRSPEASFRRDALDRLRFPDLAVPGLLPPFHGARTVTQSFDGPLTHRGPWRHGLDFEVREERGEPAALTSDPVTAYYTMNTPVLAPGAGVVVKVVDHVADNAIGESNLEENWGNLVILYLDGGFYATLGHLRQKSITVREGDRVAPGAVLGTCGNSGRSPIPHLHAQVQASALIGAPTLPFRLLNVVESGPAGRVFHSTRVPAAGSVVEPMQPDPRLSAALESLVEHTRTYVCTGPGGARKESIDCRLNEAGAFAFRSRATGALLTARVIQRVWYALEYEGGGDSLLFWMWIGLARFPLTRDAKLSWEDTVDATPLLRGPATWLADLSAPFTGLPLLRTRHRLAPDDPEQPLSGDAIEIETTVDLPRRPGLATRRAPRSLRVRIGRGAVIESMDIVTDAGPIRVRIAPEPRAGQP